MSRRQISQCAPRKSHKVSQEMLTPLTVPSVRPLVSGMALATGFTTRSLHKAPVASAAPLTEQHTQPAHWPRAVMLVLMQCSVGTLIVERLLSVGFTANVESGNWES